MISRRKRRAGRSAKQRADDHSACRQNVLRLASLKAAAERDSSPRCGAKRKGDGAPCENPSLENGRCRLHGGLTPKGDQWHRVHWPGRDAPIEKLYKKERELERRRRQLAARIAAMTPEEREQYEAHSRAVRPRTEAQRNAASQSRDTRRMFATSSSRPAARNPELEALTAERERLQLRLAELQAPAPAVETSDTITTDQKGNTDD